MEASKKYNFHIIFNFIGTGSEILSIHLEETKENVVEKTKSKIREYVIEYEGKIYRAELYIGISSGKCVMRWKIINNKLILENDFLYELNHLS
jgi:hypothetical protein